MNAIRRLAVAGALVLSGGCTAIDYYLQAVGGQLDVWQRSRAIEEVIADAGTAPGLKDKLGRVQVMREFASRELSLPDNASYRRYADIERRYVVWNVFATPEFSLAPVQWCFPFAGCVGYRGYFAQAEAERFAGERAAAGEDVFVSGVPAYSTLGWFADPVLNTFIHYPDLLIARLIFHELAHQVAYVRDDTVFNESFAVAVEREGLRRWLNRHGSDQDRKLFALMDERRAGFIRLIRAYQSRLETLYRSSVTEAAMRQEKQGIFAAMEDDYQRLKAEWGGFGGYDRWFAQKPNNAHIVSVSIYTQRVPAFEALLERHGRDLPRFYAAVKELAALAREERSARLDALHANRLSLSE